MLRIRLSEQDNLLLTRERGRAVGQRLPRDTALVLDFKGVEVASPSFLDELLRTAFQRGTQVKIVNAPAEVRQRLRVLEQVSEDRAAAASA